MLCVTPNHSLSTFGGPEALTLASSFKKCGVRISPGVGDPVNSFLATILTLSFVYN